MLSDQSMRYGYVMFVAGSVYNEWRHGTFPWWAALIGWGVTSIVGLLILSGLSWLAAQRDAWFARRAPTWRVTSLSRGVIGNAK